MPSCTLAVAAVVLVATSPLRCRRCFGRRRPSRPLDSSCSARSWLLLRGQGGGRRRTGGRRNFEDFGDFAASGFSPQVWRVPTWRSLSKKLRVTLFFNKQGVEAPEMCGVYMPYGRSPRFARNQRNDDHFITEVYIEIINQISQELDNHFDEVNMELFSYMTADSFASFDAQKIHRYIGRASGKLFGYECSQGGVEYFRFKFFVVYEHYISILKDYVRNRAYMKRTI
uniref:Uncharacterized protein n=1 Tax=Oryza sativa subsp. japonica TaxID=39947 RepID=Q2QSH1_ORYSJ|nr:hypothetical protein LOC_Os12g24130 [Oryza sativa Japonica Group]